MERHRRQMRGVTLNALKDDLYSLNRRMLLAMQNHDKVEQEKIREEMEVVQEKIGLLGFGGSVCGQESSVGLSKNEEPGHP